MTDFPRSVELVEVSPRDGLQNEDTILSVDAKVELIDRAVAAGVRRIEVASFVHPGRVPQMADAEAVCANLPYRSDVTYIGLVLNQRGLDRALNTPIDEVGAVVSASDGFGRRNQGRTSHETVNDALDIIARAKQAGKSAQVTISTAFGCPFDGQVPESQVISIVSRLIEAKPKEIALGDTIGIATPTKVARLIRQLKPLMDGIPLRVHFHDTRNTAMANVYAACCEGVSVVDASIGGAGGCPFAPGASGNVATEDVLFLLEGAEAKTGVDWRDIAKITPWLENQLKRKLPSKLAVAPRFPSAEGK